MITLRAFFKLTRSNFLLKNSQHQVTSRLFESSPFSASSKYTNDASRNSSIASLRDLASKIRVYDEIDLAAADLDWAFLLDKSNLNRIDQNASGRKASCDIHELVR